MDKFKELEILIPLKVWNKLCGDIAHALNSTKEDVEDIVSRRIENSTVEWIQYLVLRARAKNNGLKSLNRKRNYVA